MDCSGIIKPAVYCDRQQAKLTQMNQMNDQNVFMENRVLYGTKRRGAAAIAFPHLIYAGIL
jgi:phage major head subunit gpT-like protein